MNDASPHGFAEPDSWEGYYARKPPAFSDVPLSLEQWADRQIEPKRWLLGELLSTTSRAVLTADTGLGKTHIGMAMGLAMAAGEAFCHWVGSGRPARVLVIDGEMSKELVQERLADAERRFGKRPEGFFCLCNEDIEMPPLDTEQGQIWLGYLIAYFGYLDFIIFDNLGTLTVGDLTTAESWLPMIQFNKSLTKEKIGVLWINHTGKDPSKDFGTHTRLWALDVAMIATKLANRPEDIAVRLEFLKARQRKPSNRENFEPVDLILDQDRWLTSAPVKPKRKRAGLGSNEKTVLNALETAIQHNGEPSPEFSGMPTGGLVTTVDALESFAMSKLPQEKTKARNQAFRRALESLVANNWIGKHDHYLWSME